MKIFVIPCTCEVCGGPGMARNYGWFQRHIDPAVCAMYLQQRQEDLEKREKAIREEENRIFGSLGKNVCDGCGRDLGDPPVSCPRCDTEYTCPPQWIKDPTE